MFAFDLSPSHSNSPPPIEILGVGKFLEILEGGREGRKEGRKEGTRNAGIAASISSFI